MTAPGPSGDAPSRRFAGRGVAVGVGLGGLATLVLPVALVAVLGGLAAVPGLGVAVVPAALAGLVAPLVVGVVLASGHRNDPFRRGIGLGVVIGWAVTLIVGAGVCVALLRRLGG